MGRVTPQDFDDMVTAGQARKMSIDIYVPRDASALSLGAEGVARAIEAQARERRADVRVIRNGSRGLYWLEAPVEVALPGGRWAYGPVKPQDVASLFAADFLQGGAHPLSQGLTEGDSVPQEPASG